MSQCGDKPFESARNKGKHLARSAAGQTQVQSVPTLSCVCCDINFISEEEKRYHLIISTPCQLYLKKSFLDGQFLNDPPTCENYALNKYMCPFCLFTVDDGQVIYHILKVMKCRNKLEEAISKFHTQSRKFPTSQYEPQPPGRFKCCICNRKYNTRRHLKGHITLNHMTNEPFVHEASIYQCIPCQSTFHDSSQFVEHILQVHEKKTTKKCNRAM